MDRRSALVLLAGAAMFALLASVATAGPVRLWHDVPPGSQSNEGIPIPVESEETTPTIPPPGDSEPTALPAWITVTLIVIVLAVLAFAIVAIAVAAWRRRPRLRWRRLVPQDDFDVLPDIAGPMGADAADQRAALLRGAPRNAIVECWLRLEAVVAAVGLPRDPADTSTEFTAKVLATYTVDQGALDELAALYREARFSTHVMGEAARTAAIEALDALHEGFRLRRLAETAVDR